MRAFAIALGFAVVLCVATARSQPASTSYAAPDAELWREMARAFNDLPISLGAHQQIQQIMQNVQREAQIRATRARALPPKTLDEQNKPD